MSAATYPPGLCVLLLVAGNRREVVLHGSSKLICWFQLGLWSSSNRRLLISFSSMSLMIIIQGCFHTGFMTCKIYILNTFLKLWSQPWKFPGKFDLHLETSVKVSCSAEIILKKGNGVWTCVINRDYSASGMKSSAEMCLKEKLFLVCGWGCCLKLWVSVFPLTRLSRMQHLSCLLHSA